MSSTGVRIPSYRCHKGSGQAVVTIGAREVYLGKYDSPGSRQAYRRAVAEFMAAGGRAPSPATGPASDLSVAEIVAAYWHHASRYYTKDGEASSELGNIKVAMRHLKNLYGDVAAGRFGPLALKTCRQTIVETGLSRTTVNRYTNHIRAAFKWAVGEELVPAAVHHALQAVPGLRRGRSEARESEPVRPVAEVWVRKTMEFMPPPVATMTELQLLTGARPGEICILRPMDVDRRGKVWIYTPATHKTAFHGHRRVVPIGPRGQAILGPYLVRPTDAYCFSPAEAQAHRNTVKREARQSPVQPSQQDRRKRRPKWAAGDHYNTGGYAHAVGFAIASANKAARRKAVAEGREASENELIPHWHLHQLRHTAATIIRREIGLDAARALLGHKSLGITDTYAELDMALAVEAARKLG